MSAMKLINKAIRDKKTMPVDVIFSKKSKFNREEWGRRMGTVLTGENRKFCAKKAQLADLICSLCFLSSIYSFFFGFAKRKKFKNRHLFMCFVIKFKDNSLRVCNRKTSIKSLIHSQSCGA
ncbi:hypothetical protein KHA80_08270 [Anaerobacillus sp. HL2]|nr:hypothetical protein KHA80_08270 [Anaerobacillus sp. HL2]